MHHAVGIGLLVFIAIFVFGKEAARIIFATLFGVAALAFVYVMFRVVTGTI